MDIFKSFSAKSKNYKFFDFDQIYKMIFYYKIANKFIPVLSLIMLPRKMYASNVRILRNFNLKIFKHVEEEDIFCSETLELTKYTCIRNKLFCTMQIFSFQELFILSLIQIHYPRKGTTKFPCQLVMAFPHKKNTYGNENI